MATTTTTLPGLFRCTPIDLTSEEVAEIKTLAQTLKPKPKPLNLEKYRRQRKRTREEGGEKFLFRCPATVLKTPHQWYHELYGDTLSVHNLSGFTGAFCGRSGEEVWTQEFMSVTQFKELLFRCEVTTGGTNVVVSPWCPCKRGGAAVHLVQ